MAKKTDQKKTPSRKRSHRADSETGARLAMEAALAGTLRPPAHIKLTEKELPFWKSIIECRAAQLWTRSDLELAGQLARWKYQLEKYERAMQKEPLMLETKSGRIYENPKIKMITLLTSRIVQVSRMLHVHAQSAVGRARDGKNKLDEEEKAKAIVEGLKKNKFSLIKMPKQIT